MSEIELNPFNVKQRKLLQYGVILILVIFLFIYFAFVLKPSTSKLKNTTVYIENSKLQVFDDSYSLETYPDKVLMHYPYLLVIQASKQTTYVYNLDSKSKDKEIKLSLLDYDGKDSLYNKDKFTYYNEESLGVLCDLGFIKSTNEILCITKVDPNFVENKLVSIDTVSKKQKDVLIQKNLITAISVINGTTYLGVSDLYTHRNYLMIGSDRVEFPDVASFIYEMDLKPYVGSLKSAFNKNTESYYEVDGSKVLKQYSKKIYIFNLN
jgi:hypothetical protein